LSGSASGSKPATPPAGHPQASELDQGIVEAQALYDNGDFILAAEYLETLATRSGQPRFLYNAGLARMAAGHKGHAIARFSEYLQATQTDAAAPMREQAQASLEKLHVSTPSVQVQFGPLAARAGGKITARFLGRNKRRGVGGDARPILTFTSGETGLQTLYLGPGYWQIVVASRGYITREFEVSLRTRRRASKAYRIELEPDPRFREVTLHIDVDGAIPPTLKVSTRGGVDPSKPRICRPQDLVDRACKLVLRAGTWSVLTQADGYTTMERTLVIGEDSASFSLPLVPLADVTPPKVATATGKHADTNPPEDDDEDETPPPKHLPRKVKRQLQNGLNATGLPVFVGGLTAAIYGSTRYTDTISQAVDSCGGAAACQVPLLPAIRWRSAGVGLLGGGVGLLLTGLTAELDAPPAAWIAEISIGGALLVGGAAWLTANTLHINRHLETLGFGDPDWEQALDRDNSSRLAAAGITGFGAGMLVGATIGALVYHKHRRHRVATRLRLNPTIAQGHAGLLVHGHF